MCGYYFGVENTSLRHDHHPTFGICIRSDKCGHMENATSTMFEHYMYRVGYLARDIAYNHTTNTNLGLDIIDGTPWNTFRHPIYAQGNGWVSDIDDEDNGDRGIFVEITYYENGFRARYLHMDEVTVEHLQEVTAADKIGYTGWTGDSRPKSRYGTHLHFDVQWKNSREIWVYIDPLGNDTLGTPLLFPTGTFSNY
jgi:hypothetical protein